MNCLNYIIVSKICQEKVKKFLSYRFWKSRRADTYVPALLVRIVCVKLNENIMYKVKNNSVYLLTLSLSFVKIK